MIQAEDLWGVRGVHVYTVHTCLGPFIFSILVYPAESFICKLGLSYSSVSKKLKIPKKIKKLKLKKFLDDVNVMYTSSIFYRKYYSTI